MELPAVLVAEDDDQVQAIIEDASVREGLTLLPWRPLKKVSR